MTKQELKNITEEFIGNIIRSDDYDETEYNRGLNDAWELARKIACLPPKGYNLGALDVIFGRDWYGAAYILGNYTYQEALAKVEAYEKKKAEEAARPVRGDVVRVTAKDSTHSYTGVYLGQSGHEIFILVEERIAPVYLYEFDYDVEKTGEHVNFEYKKIEA